MAQSFSTSALAALALLLAMAFAPTATHAAQVPAAIEGKSIIDSTPVKLTTADPAKYTVVVFMSARCPCSASHEPLLAQLSRDYAQEARFVGIHSNADEPRDEASAHFKKAALPFPVVQDDGAKIADRFGALKTPHVFVIAPQSRKGQGGALVFEGGVDDSHEVEHATKHYLKDALESIRNHRDPEPKLARAVGCVIQR
jgi:hypothetical protein